MKHTNSALVDSSKVSAHTTSIGKLIDQVIGTRGYSVVQWKGYYLWVVIFDHQPALELIYSFFCPVLLGETGGKVGVFYQQPGIRRDDLTHNHRIRCMVFFFLSSHLPLNAIGMWKSASISYHSTYTKSLFISSPETREEHI